MTARARVGIALIAILAAGCGADPAPAPARPNLILIIGDDHGWPYFGFMGDPIVQTPHLDSLARGGTLFPYAFTTSSSCRQSLLSLLTGLEPVQWEARLDVLRAHQIRRPRYSEIVDFETLPRLLAAAGYRTFQGGKFWEGDFQNAGFEFGTKNEGADDSIATDHARLQASAGGGGLELGRSTMQPLWDFLNRDDGRPFFAWFAPKLPHTPHDAPPQYIERYAGAGLSLPALKYYANISRFDDRVGELVAFLEEAGLRENTLLVYLSDNGWQQGPTEQPDSEALGGSDGKGSMHELGVRTPLIFNWPGRIAGQRVLDVLVSSVDLFPTLLSFAGVAAPPNRSAYDLQPLLTGSGQPVAERQAVYGSSNLELRPPPETERSSAPGGDIMRREIAYTLRTRDWRYIWYFDSVDYPDREADALYQIASDPYEARNVASEHPERVSDFRREILEWLDVVTEPYRFRPGEPVNP